MPLAASGDRIAMKDFVATATPAERLPDGMMWQGSMMVLHFPLRALCSAATLEYPCSTLASCTTTMSAAVVSR